MVTGPGAGPRGRPSADATYGDLMALAVSHVRIATAQLAADSIATREDATAAVSCYRDLLHALSAQARTLVGAAGRASAAFDSVHPDQVSMAAIRFAHALERSIPVRPSRPELLSPDGLARHYASGAVAVRTATDLLLTHLDPDGRLRTPDAQWLFTAPGRAVALNDAATLAVHLADTRQRLHEKVRSSRGPGRLGRPGMVLDLAAVRDTGRDLRDVAARVLNDDPALADVLETAPARSGHRPAPIRTLDPLDELRLRVARLRQLAWELASTENIAAVSVQNLTDLAAAGVAVHASTAVVGARLTDIDLRNPMLPNSVHQHLVKADAWRRVRASLLRLHTPAPRDPVITQEARDLLRLTARLVPAERTGIGMTAQAWEPFVSTALGHAADTLDQITEWNSRTLTRLASAEQLHVPGRLLTGNQVTDNPELVTAKLTGKPVLVPEHEIAAVRAAYRAAGEPVQVSQRPGTLGRGVAPPGCERRR